MSLAHTMAVGRQAISPYRITSVGVKGCENITMFEGLKLNVNGEAQKPALEP